MTERKTAITTGKVRISYEHLLRAYARTESDEAKYSATLLIPKSDTATKAAIDAAMDAAIQEGIHKTFGGKRPPVIANPLYDGDGTRPNGEPFGAECRGCWVITASSKAKPDVVDADCNTIFTESDVYSGMFARVYINFFTYNKNGKRGVGCGLGPVQKIADGEPLGGQVHAQDVFSAFGQPAAAYAQPAPSYAAPVPSYAPRRVNPITGLPYSAT